ncbi:LysR family transcriptional regulator [Flavonifractor sp. An135]|nr:LysR family transcriptional regulator [Flavonifractor sp. An135]OUQ18429.1 LysR family transcriptional regulator [Flavonifractor sp. An135]
MNTTQLECFMAVSNFLNFSRAAEHLRITQPAVSHQISTLEDELGVKLFHRTSKSVRLTPEGYLFTQYAGEMLKLAGLSKARLKECLSDLPARLGIGCRNTIELRMLRPVLARLREERPEVMPLLRLIPFDSLENQLSEGELQLIFSFQESASKKARYHELLRCPAVCVCAPDHPLAEEPFLTVERLRSAGAMAAFTLAEAGYALAVVPDLPGARLPGLRYIPLPEFEPLSFGAVYLPGERTPALRTLLTLLEEVLRSAQ